MDHMRISGTEPSSVVLSQRSNFKNWNEMSQTCQNKLKPRAFHFHNIAFQIEHRQYGGDDTSLNNIALLCSRPWNWNGSNIYYVAPYVRGFADMPRDYLLCSSFVINFFLSAFSLQVEPSRVR